MNKKLLSALLALGICFTMTGCDQIPGVDKAKDWLDSVTDGTFLEDKFNQGTSEDESSSGPSSETPDVVYDLEGAKTFLKAQEQASENKSTRNDYQMMNTITYNGVVYAVAWSVDVTEGVVVKAGDTHSTIDLDQTLAEDLAYVLTATISDKDGNSVEISFNRTALAASALVPAAIEEAPQEGVMYKYYVRQSTKEKDLYFAGSMNGYYFSTTEEIGEAVDLYVEYLEGSTEEFYLRFDHKTDGKMYIGVRQNGTHNNVVYESAPVSTFKWNAELKTITTTVPIDGVDTEFYLGNYSTHMTISASKISYAGGDGNNVGQLVAMVDRNNVSDNAKVEATAKEITMAKAYVANGTLELATQGSMYADVAITWAVEGTGATVADGVVTFADIDANTTLTLKATYACGEASKTVDYTFALIKNTPADIVAGAYALQQDESFGNEATLTGVISKIGTAYDENYGNITVTMIVEGKKIDCYRLSGDGSNELAVGYTITVTGKFTNYKDTIQFGQGCQLNSFVVGDESNVPEIDGGEDAPVVGENTIVIESYASANGWTNGTMYESVAGADFTATASCAKPNETYGQSTSKYYTSDQSWRLYQAEAASLTISAVEGKYIVSVKITYIAQNTGLITLGDAAVVSDALVTVNAGTVTFGVANSGTADNGQARITAIEVICADGVGSGEGSITPPEGGETPDAPELPAANSTLTISEVLALTYSSDTTDKYYVTGTITEIYNTTYGNMYITDESGNTLTVYGTYSADGSTRFDAMDASAQPKVGDTVKFYSILSSYSGKNQLKNAWIIEINGEGSGEVTPPAGGDDEGGDEVTGELVATVPVVGTPYIFGMAQGNLNNQMYYLAGGMDGYYMATTTDATKAIKTYIEETTGGYYFYTYVGETKTYINMVVSGTHVNGAYEATASTVYTIDETNKTLIAVVNDADYWFGTRNDKTYTTMGPCAVSYAGFFGVFYGEATGNEGGEGETPAPDTHEHSYTAAVTAPTCTEAGYTTYTCNCGASYTEAGEAATGHSFNEGTCGVCGETDPNYTPEGGEGEDVAQIAGSADFNTITLPSSKPNGDSSYTATYTTANGWTTEYSAIQCGGTTDMNPQFVVIGSDNTYKAPCLNGKTSAPGKLTSPTLTGGISKLVINYTKMFTDTELGFKVTITDLTTGAIYTDTESVTLEKNEKYVKYNYEFVLETAITGDFTIVIENTCPTGQDGNKDRVTLLNVSWYAPAEGGETPAPDTHEHNYTAAVTAPTCTEAGYTTFTCNCGDSYTEAGEAATGHTFVEGTCGVCGETDPEYVAPEVHEHSYGEGVVTAPTCTAAGYTTFTCACGDSYTEAGEGATGHADNDNNYKCDNCSTKMLPPADSALTLAQAIAVAQVAGSSYTTEKYYITVEIVNVYNTTYGNMNVTDADGNDFVIYGTYSYDGKTRYDALTYKPVAGDEITVYGILGTYNGTAQMKDAWIDEVVAHNHVYGEVVTAPTCTSKGYTTFTCEICENTYKGAETEALGHTTEQGTCGNCGQEIGGDAPVMEEKSYTYTFSSTQFSANGTKALGGVNWTLAGTGGNYWGYDGTKGQQLGSKNAPYTSMTLTSANFNNVSKISINTSGASGIVSKCNVYVGDTLVKTISITTTATTYTVDVEGLSGEVKFEYTSTTARGLYIKSIAVDYAEVVA